MLTADGQKMVVGCYDTRIPSLHTAVLNAVVLHKGLDFLLKKTDIDFLSGCLFNWKD